MQLTLHILSVMIRSFAWFLWLSDFISLVIQVFQTVFIDLPLFFDSPFLFCFVSVNCFCLAGSTIASCCHSFVYALSCSTHVWLSTLLWFSDIDFARFFAALAPPSYYRRWQRRALAVAEDPLHHSALLAPEILAGSQPARQHWTGQRSGD
jgi:hypothetical protein